MFWHIGNTTIRNPYRIKDLAQAFHENQDKLNDLYKTGEKAELEQSKLFEIAKKTGVIKTNTSEFSSKAWHGRKLRLTLFEMGIITDGRYDNSNKCQLTKTGLMLINSDDEQQQYCWLRIIFSLETRKTGYNNRISKPLKPAPLILSILLNLKNSGYKSVLSIHELALIVMTGTPDKSINEYVMEIIELREELKTNQGNIRNLLDSKYKAVARKNNIKQNTINDYKDVTRRYLLISGVFLEKGNGIIINPNYDKQAELLSQEIESLEWDEKDLYFKKLTSFPKLSINENKDLLVSLIKENHEQIINNDIKVENPNFEKSIEELEMVRVSQDIQIRNIKEREFAYAQRNKTNVILKWIEYLQSGRSPDIEIDDEYLSFRSSDERPKLLEWIIWRAFLSINCLKNQPYDSRNFKLDPNFKPINHAPGGLADLVFEFEDFILVVELTWLTSSRQTSNEVMPVANHVAKVANSSKKKVFGLLIAPSIDSNTLLDYKTKDTVILNENGNEIEQKIDLIPITIEQFKIFFNNIPKANPNNPRKLYSILNNCRDQTALNKSYTDWKEHINSQFLN